MFYTVYKITNLVNDKIYIGVHKTTDLSDDYMGSGKLIKSAIEKYGIENFKKEYIEVFDNAEDMFDMESQLVNEEFVSRDDTYNLKEGGYGGWNHCLHLQKEKLVKARKVLEQQRKDTPEKFEYLKIVGSKNFKMAHKDGKIKYDNFTNKKHTDETKKKIGDANSNHQSGKGNSQYGTMWVHNLTEKVSKKIKKDEFSTWEQQGWLKGRKMKF